MSSKGPLSTWITLLEKKKQEISGFEPEDALASDKVIFRYALSSFAPEGRRWNEPHSQWLGCQISVVDVARRAHFIQGWKEYPRNEVVFPIWRAASLLLERARKYGIGAENFAELLNKFTPDIPEMLLEDGEEWLIIKHGNEEYVQEPLQHIFRCYIDLHLSIVRQLDKLPSEGSKDLANDPEICMQLNGSVNKITRAWNEYKDARSIMRRAEPNLGLHAHRDSSGSSFGTVGKDKYAALGEPLGTGSFATVHKVYEAATKMYYVRKRLHSAGSRTSAVAEAEFQNELKILKKLEHDHIIKFIETFKDVDGYFNLIMRPVADCDLWDYLHMRSQRENSLDRTEKMYPWFGCLLHALDYMHTKGIKHQDIKPNNILVHGNNVILTDFGRAKDFSLSDQSESNSIGDGNLIHRAPEMNPGIAADIFSLGCVYSEMLTVLRGKSILEFQEFRINKSCGEKDQYAFRHCLPKVIEWVMNLADADEDERVTTLVDLVKGMVVKEPPEDRLKHGGPIEKLQFEPRFWCEAHLPKGHK